MDEKKYKQYLNILELEENPSMAEIKTAYERLKKVFSTDSIVMEAIDDEFPEEDKQKIMTDIHEAYSGLFHYLVEKDRIEKEKFEKEKTAKEIFDVDDFEDIEEELNDPYAPLFFKEEEILEEISEEIVGEKIEEKIESSAIVERSDTWMPPTIPEHLELPEQIALPEIPDLGEPEPEEVLEAFPTPELLNTQEPLKINNFQDTQELFIAEDPLELPEYIFPEPTQPEDIPPELENGRSPYSTMIRVIDPSATNPMEDTLIDPNMENYETGGAAIIKGRTFKKYRERMGLGIHDLARTSKISYKILVNIELERFEDLPEPGYLRWCVSTYAKELGMDSPTIAEEYMKRYRQWKRQQVQQ